MWVTDGPRNDCTALAQRRELGRSAYLLLVSDDDGGITAGQRLPIVSRRDYVDGRGPPDQASFNGPDLLTGSRLDTLHDPIDGGFVFIDEAPLGQTSLLRLHFEVNGVSGWADVPRSPCP